jgi:hypothetical protein
VSEEPVVERIFNMINGNVMQKKRKENNIMVSCQNVSNDDLISEKMNDLMQKIGVKKFSIKNVDRIIKKDKTNDLAPIIVELVNQSDRFVILKAAKALAKINVENDTYKS